ncbi:discoidin domain-containing protein [Arthrobacter psychrochitiniphilus]|uniref:exo-alpha-sialidase n=1 Tax=Arthrobacter psychrochitiniphilus TaxID=291045 RepID=A0A2V3DT28_9MICC|nr:discoidin domain-containing protein [Arthrobacter psychrochitiniphilus]NYG18969.1 hypothetical protein [Arthrobacter psychrochitiniphilus]PXA66036.1 hypothetical protein CVS29_08605 [Arthrobacter psychrochitiniphilus]
MKSINRVPRLKRGKVVGTAVLLAGGLLAGMVAGPAFAQDPAPAPLAVTSSYTEQILAQNGDNKIDPSLGRYYRIPALVDLGNGIVLASYDGRPDGADAPSPNSIVQRRSTDGGKTWGAPTYIARGQEAKNGNLRYGFSDPSYIFDQETGDVFNFHVYSKDVSFQGSGYGNDDADRNIISSAVAVSKDKGLTWSTDPGNMPNLPPSDYTAESAYAGLDGPLITDIVKPNGDANNVGGISGVFAASGEGIQLKYGPNKGRLIQQFTGKVKQANGNVPYQAYSVYSDDHGKTWERGAFTGTGMDENKSVELSNGDVMLNSRASSGERARKVAISKDGGQSYGPVTVDTNLVDPVNNASITRMYPHAAQGSAEAKMLLFSNANSSNGRSNGTIRYSCDDGTTWSAGKQFKAGAMSYSTATALSDGAFGVFYEGDNNTMTFGKFDAAWLEVDCGAAMNATLSGAAAIGANGATVQATLTVRNNAETTLSGATASFAPKTGWTFGSTIVPDVAAGASVDVQVPVTIPSFLKAGNITVSATLSRGAFKVTSNVSVTVTGGAASNIAGLDIKGLATDTARDLAATPYTVGSLVPYKFQVDSLSNVAVEAIPTSGNFNPLLRVAEGGTTDTGNCRFGNLGVGNGYPCTTPKHAVTAAELANGFFVPLTTWEARATGAETKKYTITGAEVDLLVRKPSVTATITAGELVDVDESGFASVGDTVTYTSVVTNNGNVNLSDITVSGWDKFSLAAGESKTVTSLYTLTAADVAANMVGAKGLAVTAKNGLKSAAATASSASVIACSDALCGARAPMANQIPQNQLTIKSVSSQELVGEAAPNGPAKALIDGNIDSFWHTKWQGGTDPFPHSVVFDLGASYDVTGFEYTQRQNGPNGRIKDYEIFVSDSPTEFGTKVASGTFTSVLEGQRITIEGNKSGRYLKLVALNSIANNAYAGGAEVNIAGVAVSTVPAVISATPGTVAAGSDITVSLSGFPADSVVELTLNNGLSLGTVTTDAAGAVTKTVTVPANTPAASHELRATSGTTTATTALVVTLKPVVGATVTGERADKDRDLATSPYTVGQSLPYNFVVKSTANVTSAVYPTAGEFTGFNITGTPNCRYRDLAAGAAFTCTTAKRVITAEDVANGFFTPVTKWAAEATGATKVEFTADGGEVDVLIRKPSLALTIGAGVLATQDESSYASEGDVVTYAVTLKNDGNVALTGVSVPGVDGIAATLAAGASSTGTIKHTVTANDLTATAIDAKSFTATASNGSKAASKEATRESFALLAAPTTEPTTAPPTTDPTTAPPTTAPPTTAPPTADPTTAPPTTVPPSTAPGADEATGEVNVANVVAGQKVTITGKNFKPGTTATFTLHSEPGVLGEAIVGKGGTVSLTTTIPVSLPAGQHTVVITGTDASGADAAVSIELQVTAAGGTPSAAATATATDTATETATATATATDTATTSDAATTVGTDNSNGELASTGFGLMPLGLAGAVLVLLGGVLAMRRASMKGARH